jgi:holo-[acyl-carrier protein] synthase
MIYGIGIDIVKTERMKDVIEKWGEKFLQRVFTGNEISYCYKKQNPYLSLSARFAAKEAFIKAIGSEITVKFSDIEVINSDKGKPVLVLGGRIKDFLKTRKVRTTHLSLSHEHDYSLACVVLEQ